MQEVASSGPSKEDKKLIKKLAKTGDWDTILSRWGAKWLKKAKYYASSKSQGEEDGDAPSSQPGEDTTVPVDMPSELEATSEAAVATKSSKSAVSDTAGEQWIPVEVEADSDVAAVPSTAASARTVAHADIESASSDAYASVDANSKGSGIKKVLFTSKVSRCTSLLSPPTCTATSEGGAHPRPVVIYGPLALSTVNGMRYLYFGNRSKAYSCVGFLSSLFHLKDASCVTQNPNSIHQLVRRRDLPSHVPSHTGQPKPQLQLGG